jgi:hypothetical protein
LILFANFKFSNHWSSVMSSQIATSVNNLARYNERAKHLGLDPNAFASGRIPVVISVEGIERMRTLVALPSAAHVPESPLSPEKMQSVEDGVARHAIVNHIFSVKSLSAATLHAADHRFRHIPLFVYQAPDIQVTALNPLIINRNSSVTNFGVVTIKDGGYIDISVDCNFTCDVLQKIAGGNTGAPYDLSIHGTHGGAGDTPAAKPAGQTGDGGSNAECSCCGGDVAHGSTNGGNGVSGADGDSASNGHNGLNGPTVYVSIGNLIGTLTVAAAGGTGGRGGSGGTGGAGGTGGVGGNGETCGAFHPDGAVGGVGGNGGNGGAAADGGDAGNGGMTTINYTASNPSSRVVASNLAAPGGRKGDAGTGGGAGAGGAGGSGGGSQGAPGTKGNNGSDSARDGAKGAPGTLLVNGQPIS